MTQDRRDKAVPTSPDEEPPPILRSWPRLYAVVLLHLAFWILILYLFTACFHLPS